MTRNQTKVHTCRV